MSPQPHARQALGGAPLFARLPTALLDEVAARARPVLLPAGAWLMRQGDPGDAAYTVCSGRLEVVSERPPHGIGSPFSLVSVGTSKHWS